MIGGLLSIDLHEISKPAPRKLLFLRYVFVLFGALYIQDIRQWYIECHFTQIINAPNSNVVTISDKAYVITFLDAIAEKKNEEYEFW